MLVKTQVWWPVQIEARDEQGDSQSRASRLEVGSIQKVGAITIKFSWKMRSLIDKVDSKASNFDSRDRAVIRAGLSQALLLEIALQI